MTNVNYVLLDAARMGGFIEDARILNEQNEILYTSKEEQHLETVAPFLFSYYQNTDFDIWLRKEGWGNSWGIFIQSNASIDQICKHFSKFTTTRTKDGAEMYYRFYDPRVLRSLLPGYDPIQLREFFGPLEKIVCEDENSEFALNFSFEGNKLITKKTEAKGIYSESNKVASYLDYWKSTDEPNSDEWNNSNSPTKFPGWFSK
jgi:hypothetical protein